MKKTPKESNYLKPSRWMYDLGLSLLCAKEFINKRVYVEGTEKIPEKGPMLVLANHTNYIDPVYLAYAFHKYTKTGIHLNFMMLPDLFGNNVLSRLVNKLTNKVNAYQVNRERITPEQHIFFKKILHDDFLAIFFGGTRSRDGRFNYMLKKERPPTGLVHLAELAQKESNNPVKIMPVAITYNILKDITITFGHHMIFKGQEDIAGHREKRKKFAEDIIDNIGCQVKVNLDTIFANYLVQYAANSSSESGKAVLSAEKCCNDLYSIVNSLSEYSKINLDMALLNEKYFSDKFSAVSSYFQKKGMIKSVKGINYLLDKEEAINKPYITENKTKEEVKKMGLAERGKYNKNIRKVSRNLVYNSNKIIHLEEVTSEVYKRIKKS